MLLSCGVERVFNIGSSILTCHIMPFGIFCPRLGVCLVRGLYFLSIMASLITASCPDYKNFQKDPNYPHCCLCDVEVSENPTSWRWHVQGKQHNRKKEKLKVEEAPPKGAGKRHRSRSPSCSHQPDHGKRRRVPSMCAATGPELF